MEGVKYKLGVNDEQTVIPVSIHIDGKLSRSLIGRQTFKGKLSIEGEHIPVPENQDQLELHFEKNRSALMVYRYYENGQPKMYSYGQLYINKDFSELTIAVYTKDGEGGGSWDGNDGLMISAPASDRMNALQLSNRLMKAMMGQFLLK
ncbi:hypothetical protein [Paenibacillus luteus]|uniref:hypothetical protein n=1 Tax=Paenibacillus luteus TaxID=2545753 RepID=UPI0019D579B0|nr:hypothetical protein [Paenibacillus luteus]